MKKQIVSLASVMLLSLIILSACSSVSAVVSKTTSNLSLPRLVSQSPTEAAPSATSNTIVTTTVQSAVPASTTTTTTSVTDLLAAYEGTLEGVYTTVSPQVVNIHVVAQVTGANIQVFPGFPNVPQSQTPQYAEALGSGFVWDKQGHIVTNNHVVEGAQKIDVTFSDGTNVPATVVGTDPYSDLAVLQVNVSADKLFPVQMADSTQVKVGQLGIAIGNPFGLEGTMTVGIISAVGRTLPSNLSQTGSAPSYSIPDMIQTDAPINPGNSGGVLVDNLGQVIGVTSAIESTNGSGAGIGFAIPAEIVQQVVPALISTGHFDHSYLGVTMTDMIPDISSAMGLDTATRGVLVEQVAPNGPADNAGLRGSTTPVTINGIQGMVGGDVITAIDGQTVKTTADVIAYLAIHTQVGQTITLTILRSGQTQTLQVTLGTRPSQ
jgi:2-alkenal reductase